MKRLRQMFLALVLLVCAAVTAGFSTPTTLAYMQQESNTVQNKLNVVYTPPEDTSVPVRVHKTVISLVEETISPAGFQFALRDTATNQIIHLTTDALGNASIELPFTAEDVGKTYTYELYEVEGDNEHIIYSTEVYTIRIALTVNMYNQVSAAVSVNGIDVQQVSASFENQYMPIVPPDTGDHDQPLMYAVLIVLSCAGLALLLKQRKAAI